MYTRHLRSTHFTIPLPLQSPSSSQAKPTTPSTRQNLREPSASLPTHPRTLTKIPTPVHRLVGDLGPTGCVRRHL
ncbi:hypothetical protein EJ02DRAFT_59461 [Clathrospora elynae]|uniref:Uncharacterized protein n=1 Tax=Clathrospora elynae TaxID=706981 RepID=A0A6A5SWY5_9PLEO|nr:hypothetical protein EJ02DRAFT_59461 [Clathrospora elynae]